MSYQIRTRHVKLLARQQVKYSIRGGSGLVFGLLSLVAGLIIASIFISPIENFQKQFEDSDVENSEEISKLAVDKFVEELGAPAIGWFTGADDEQTNYLAFDKPAIVSAFMIVFMAFLPYLIAFGAFNQTSGDISNRGLRYLLLRTERINIFLGRFIGTYLFTVVVLGVLTAVVLLYLLLKAKLYPAGDVSLWLLQGYFAFAMLALPYVALCAWLSTVIDSPFGVLVIIIAIIGGFSLFIWFGALQAEQIKYGAYLMPWGFKYMLLQGNLGLRLLAVAAMLGFTALFLWLGARHFQKRDL